LSPSTASLRLIFIIEAQMQWSRACSGLNIEHPTAGANAELDVPRRIHPIASCVTRRFERAMIRAISGRQTMEHESKTFRMFDDLEVYQVDP
jgi:hypothetical protein